MAYAESTMGGSTGTSYRIWVNSIRTYNGNSVENFEDWRVEGGLNKLSSGVSAYNNLGNSSYRLQLGLNGVASAGNFNYNFAAGTTGRVLAWGTGATRVYRNAAGVGFGFTSRMDLNCQNSFLGAGWVQSSDAIQTKLRHAYATALSMDAGGIPATDEGPMWIEFANPAGAAVDAYIESPPGVLRMVSVPNVTSRYNFDFTSGALATALQLASPNSNTATLRIGIHDSMGGDNYNYHDRTYTIKNDVGQANPTFTDFDYLDTNAATVAVTGSNQVLIQGKSTLQVNIPTGKKATPNKNASMNQYTTTIGAYSGNTPFSAVATVTNNVGLVSVTGVQGLGVRAIDSRNNGTTVTKNVTVLPYANPAVFGALRVKYANSFDATDGIEVELRNGTEIASVSPLTLASVDKNVPSTTTAVRFDISKGNDSSFTGDWTNVTTTNATDHTGVINTDAETLATAILGKMATLGLDNTSRWYIAFSVTDAFITQYYTTYIDIGRPMFRIGLDGHLYHNEVEFHEEFNPTNNIRVDGILAVGVVGTFSYTGLSGFAFGSGALSNTSGAIGDWMYIPVYLNAGTYDLSAGFVGANNRGISACYISGGSYDGSGAQFTRDAYNATSTEFIETLTGIVIDKAGVYNFEFHVTGKNASSSLAMQSINGLKFVRTA